MYVFTTYYFGQRLNVFCLFKSERLHCTRCNKIDTELRRLYNVLVKLSYNVKPTGHVKRLNNVLFGQRLNAFAWLNQNVCITCTRCNKIGTELRRLYNVLVKLTYNVYRIGHAKRLYNVLLWLMIDRFILFKIKRLDNV